jgi:hypothetical protein
MNNYRFRLVLASVSLTAALTVLALKLAGFLSPPTGHDTLQLFASNRPTQAGISPYQLSCKQQIATIVDSEQAWPPRALFDAQGLAIRCRQQP